MSIQCQVKVRETPKGEGFPSYTHECTHHTDNTSQLLETFMLQYVPSIRNRPLYVTFVISHNNLWGEMCMERGTRIYNRDSTVVDEITTQMDKLRLKQ